MTRLRLTGLALGSLALGVTDLMVLNATPDAAQHQRVLANLLTLSQASAALQRDVLQTRAGLLENYDPLNEEVASLRRASRDLREARTIATGAAGPEMDRALRDLIDTVDAREAQVERFKTVNALARNSWRIVTSASRRIREQDSETASDVGRFAIALIDFGNHPEGESRNDAVATLALAQSWALAAGATADIRSIASHGQILIDTLPRVDALAREVQDLRIIERADRVRQLYLDAVDAMARRAAWLTNFLYASALALGLYVLVLIVRLQASRNALRRRAALEGTAAAISARFVALPWDRTAEGMSFGLAQVAAHTDAREAHVVILDHDRRIVAEHRWPATSEPLGPKDIVGVPEAPRRAGPGAASPGDGTDRTAVLRFPMRHRDVSAGYLILKTRAGERRRAEQDRALLGVIGEILGTAIDRARAEQERHDLQRRLAQAQRLEALGILAGGIAHEFNNILGAIRGHAELAVDLLRGEDRAGNHVARILTASARAQSVIDKVLAFGRQRPHRLQPFDAGKALEEALALLRASLPAGIALEVASVAGKGLVGDLTEFQQIVMNLCNNAAQALGGRGTVAIRLSEADRPAGARLSHGELAPGRYLVLEVRDPGPGIAPEVLQRMFEPFFTTKRKGVGTGLGLSTVHGIVTAWGGGLDVASAAGRGTRMQVHLPMATEPAGEAGPVAAPLARGRGETVLLVGPDDAQLLLDEEILAALGYEPVGFRETDEALAALAATPSRFEAALVEVPPGRAGRAALDGLAALRPDLPVLLVAAPGGEVDPAVLRSVRSRDVLCRPLRSRDLAEGLARCLADAKAGAIAR